MAVFAFGDEARGEEPVRSFGFPLLLFAETPEDEDGGEDDREDEREPGAIRYFGEDG